MRSAAKHCGKLQGISPDRPTARPPPARSFSPSVPPLCGTSSFQGVTSGAKGSGTCPGGILLETEQLHRAKPVGPWPVKAQPKSFLPASPPLAWSHLRAGVAGTCRSREQHGVQRKHPKWKQARGQDHRLGQAGEA